jgi:hypothetical protein
MLCKERNTSALRSRNCSQNVAAKHTSRKTDRNADRHANNKARCTQLNCITSKACMNAKSKNQMYAECVKLNMLSRSAFLMIDASSIAHTLANIM